MNGNMSPLPTKGQMIEIMFGGKTYKICSEGQMNYLLAVGLNAIQMRATQENKALSEEELKKELQQYRENCGYAVLNDLLVKVSPEERERWKTNYRFSGIIKRAVE